MTPLPHFQCITPLGRAICIGVVDDTDNVEWVTFINATGEPWYWRNPEFRLAPCITAGRASVSPFPPASWKLEKEIARYRKAGWLPFEKTATQEKFTAGADTDATKVEWRTELGFTLWLAAGFDPNDVMSVPGVKWERVR